MLASAASVQGMISIASVMHISATGAVESAIEICKLGEDSRDQKKYFAACDAAIKRTGFDWGECIKECGDPDFAYLTREARTSAAQKKAPTIEVHVIKL